MTTANTATKRFYNLKQSADILGIGYTTMRTYITQGKIPYVVVGRRKMLTEKIIADIEDGR